MRKATLLHYKPLYVVFLPAVVVVNLFVNNITEVSPGVILRPILALLLLSLIFFGVFTLATRDTQRSGVLTLGLLVSMLYYGRCYQYLKDHLVFGINLGRHSLLGTAWIIVTLAFLVVFLLKRTRVKPDTSFFFNIVTILLLVFYCAQILTTHNGFIPTRTGVSTSTSTEVISQQAWINQVEQPIHVSSENQLPDIYYIIPDMFARTEVIESETGLDSTSFTQELVDLGFEIVDCSRSNYASTQLSIASEMNLNYLDQIQTGLTDRDSLSEPMNESLLRHSLESIGYKTVVLENGFGLPEIFDADFTIKPVTDFILFQPFTPFENLIVSNSFLRVFYDVKLGPLSKLYDFLFFPYWEHVRAQKFILDELPNLQDIEGPKFVFAHIMMPHPPYLVHADGTIEMDSRYYREALGQPVNEELYLQGYQMQVEYLENRLPQIVAEIIAESDTPPVIIIQGDHGIRYTNRLDNFTAIYAPESVLDEVYPTMSSVNTWRAVFNGMFETNYQLLEDLSYYSEYPDWFEMEILPENDAACIFEDSVK